MRISDWSSDVCSSDLRDGGAAGPSQEIGLARPARHAKIEPMGSIGLFDHRHLAALVEVVDRHRAEKFLRRRIDRDDPDSLEKIGIVAVHTARRRVSISANQRADKYDVAHGGGRPYSDSIFNRGGKSLDEHT